MLTPNSCRRSCGRPPRSRRVPRSPCDRSQRRRERYARPDCRDHRTVERRERRIRQGGRHRVPRGWRGRRRVPGARRGGDARPRRRPVRRVAVRRLVADSPRPSPQFARRASTLPAGCGAWSNWSVGRYRVPRPSRSPTVRGGAHPFASTRSQRRARCWPAPWFWTRGDASPSSVAVRSMNTHDRRYCLHNVRRNASSKP
jgi:hypothetical protein